MQRRTLVVVGHGMVGHRLVEAAVDRGLTAEWGVVVLAGEKVPAYHRVALSSWFTGTTAERPQPARPEERAPVLVAGPTLAVVR